MPHTSRPKPPKTSSIPKPLHITDDSGWTHITKAHKGNTRRRQQQILRSTKPNTSSDSNENENENDKNQFLVPAEIPARMTLDILLKQYHTAGETFENSSTFQTLHSQTSEALQRMRSETTQPITNIICIGLGSPSGLLRGGWVDRRNVSMTQLIALTTLISLFQNHNPDLKIKVYAQDPVFNTLDHTLLSHLNITPTSTAFSLITPQSFLYAPGAERSHLEQLLPRNPRFFFGGPLEDSDSGVLKGFCGGFEAKEVGVYEPLEAAFWGMRLYYRLDDKADGEGTHL